MPVLIPLKGLIESSKQNSCLMCRVSPPLMADDDSSGAQASAADGGG